MAKKLIVTAMTAGALMTLPVTSGTAHAAGTARLEKAQQLTHKPVPGMPSGKQQRRIYLKAGKYEWSAHIGGFNIGGKRNIHLAAGWYTWTVYIHPGRGKYTVDAYLDPDRRGATTATVRGRAALANSGKYVWGSYLG